MEQFLSGSKIATRCDKDDTIVKMTFIRLEDIPHFFFSSSNYFNGNKRMLRKFISDSLKHEDYHRFIRNINLVNCVKIWPKRKYTPIQSKVNIKKQWTFSNRIWKRISAVKKSYWSSKTLCFSGHFSCTSPTITKLWTMQRSAVNITISHFLHIATVM